MDVEENVDEDTMSGLDEMEWKGNLRGAPQLAYRILRNKKTGVVSRPSGASEVNPLPIYDDDVIDISSE